MKEIRRLPFYHSSVFKNRNRLKDLTEPVLIEWEVFSQGESFDFTMIRNQLQIMVKPLHGHFPSTGAVSSQFRIGKTGGMKELRIKNIDIQVNKKLRVGLDKFFDLLIADEVLILNSISHSGFVKKFFLIIMEILQSEIKD